MDLNIKYAQDCQSCGKTFRTRRIFCVIDTKTESIKRVGNKKTCKACQTKLDMEWTLFKWTHNA